jgi:hypothetical protein
MTQGPLQILVLNFEDPKFQGDIADELERLEANGTLRVLDLAFVTKSREGVIDAAMTHQLHSGAIVRILLGMEGAADAPADDLDLWDAADAIPPGTAAAVVVFEHTWAAPLRAAVQREGGRAVASEWVDMEYLSKLGVTQAT